MFESSFDMIFFFNFEIFSRGLSNDTGNTTKMRFDHQIKDRTKVKQCLNEG